ncbi:hypothetical protein Tco_1446806 [Tanacetum coccineum]
MSALDSNLLESIISMEEVKSAVWVCDGSKSPRVSVAKVMAGVSDVDVLLGGILLTQDNAYSSGKEISRGSNSSDGGNTGDGVKIAGEVIGSGGEIVSSRLLHLKQELLHLRALYGIVHDLLSQDQDAWQMDLDQRTRTLP